MKKLIISTIAVILAAMLVQAQDKPTFKINPTGRILMDGALYASPEKEMFKDGVAIPDVRLGAKVKYDKWSAKIDVGFSYNKLGLKDIYIQYDFDEANTLRGGSFIHQYGLQASTSSSMKCTFEEPISNSVFNASRQIGFMYVHNTAPFLGTLSLHAEPNTITQSPNELNKQGYGALTRLVYRKVADGGRIAQVGVSGGFLTPQNKKDSYHNAFSFASNFPTRVDKVGAVDATILGAKNQLKFTPELLLAYGPVALEAQYFYNHVNMRDGLHGFTGQGAYGTLRGLIFGSRSYGYASFDGGLATPAPKTMELVLGYNYTSLTDRKAQTRNEDGDVLTGIYGGRVNTMSATLNYYINKYMLVRLNYTYTYRWDAASAPDVTFNVVQARVQILF